MTGTDDARAIRERYGARVRGCLLGGAIGDALGAPVERWGLDRIRAEVGPGGVREYLPYVPDPDTGTGSVGAVDGRATHGLVTDDTQMTLFTVEGLIRAGIRRDRGIGFTVAVVHAAYDRWLDTQLLHRPPDGPTGWLGQQRWLYARRGPGTTCLGALTASRAGADHIPQYGHPADNASKGCGGVMRSAPFGLLPPDLWPPDRVFDQAAEAAGYTHGHPTARLAAGTLAAAVGGLVAGDELDRALDRATDILARHDDHDETRRALAAARTAATTNPPGAETLVTLGEGWQGHEALAIGVYAALAFPAPDQMLDALALAVSHGGDSDSTGSICGQLLGAWHGDGALPPALAFEVEGRGTILQLADDLVWEFTASEHLHGDYGPFTRWTQRY
jgi:ADP-ribosylglycohydrolase